MKEFIIPLAKIDEAQRLVYGRAIQEVIDRTNEIIDYETAKPAFQSWSKQFEEATNGLSRGNLRVMHDPKKVAGKIIDLTFNDDEKAIDVVAKVVDDQEWKKVVEGVLTGFSVGGGYGKKWKDPETGATRYTPVVTEVSLVDLPCIPTARISLAKGVDFLRADGTTEILHLTGRVRSFEDIYKPHRSFTEVMLEKGWASGARRVGDELGVTGRAGAMRQMRRGYRNFSSLAGKFNVDEKSAGRQGADAARFNFKVARASTLAHAGLTALAGGTAITQTVLERRRASGAGAATALSEAELDQRRAAGRASAEKRRNRAGD